MAIATVNAAGTFMSDEHGTEIRAEIGMDRGHLLLVAIGVVVIFALAAYNAFVNWSSPNARGMLILIPIAVVVLIIYMMVMNDPAFLEGHLKTTLAVEDAEAGPA